MVDLFLRWWLRTARYPWSRLRRRLFERKYTTLALPPVGSLEDIEACLRRVTWTMDGPLHLFDAISYPHTVWAKKKDDCDGFAVLAAALLKVWRPAARPVLVTAMLRPMRKSHTVCAFMADAEELWFFDNFSLRRGRYRSYGEIAGEVGRADRLVCWDVADPETLRTHEFHLAAQT